MQKEQAEESASTAPPDVRTARSALWSVVADIASAFEDDAVLSSSLSATAVFVRRGLSFTPPGLPPRGLILMPSMVLCFADVYVCCWRTFVATAAARWGVMVLGCVLGCTRR